MNKANFLMIMILFMLSSAVMASDFGGFGDPGTGDLIGVTCSPEGAKGFVENYKVMCKKETIMRKFKTCSGPVSADFTALGFREVKKPRWYIQTLIGGTINAVNASN